MENKKGFGVVGLVVLCLTVSAFFGIAYAAFTQNLTINGSASVQPQKWEVKWKSIAKNTDITTPTITATVPTINEKVTDISSWQATFTMPGQTFAFDVTAKNYGDFSAKLASVTGLSTPSSLLHCTPATVGAGETAATDAQASAVCNNLSLQILKGNAALTVGDGGNASVLAKNDEETYRFILTYSQDASDQTGATLPAGPVDVTVDEITFSYNQHSVN